MSSSSLSWYWPRGLRTPPVAPSANNLLRPELRELIDRYVDKDDPFLRPPLAECSKLLKIELEDEAECGLATHAAARRAGWSELQMHLALGHRRKARIYSDPRHRDIFLISVRDVEARDFSSSDMGYASLGEMSRGIVQNYIPDLVLEGSYLGAEAQRVG